MLFSDYMNEWLYGDGGYYRHFRDIGKSGDFYTAVSTSAFFGASIANHIWKKIESKELPRDIFLIEIGAHKGYLLADMIQWLYTCDSSLIDSMRFGIVERQSDVQKIQKEYFNQRFGSAVELKHFSTLEEVDTEYGVYVSNEIFDAFPCELYKDGEIAFVENSGIKWQKASERIIDFAEKYGLKKGEIAVGYEEFAKRVSNSAKNSLFISFDYGEKYVRNDFSIRIYKGHKTYPLFDDEVDLSEMFKNSDITYDVNFAHLIDAFKSAGMELENYETQARALIRYGVIDILEQYSKVSKYENYIREADKIKTLISPTIMGDRFKVVEFKKG